MIATAPLDALVTELESRLAAASEDARTYPGPIARCDDQLPALLERRQRLREALEAARRLRASLDALA